MPSISQGLFSLNKDKYAIPSVTRGNTISRGNSSSIFGGTDNMDIGTSNPKKITPLLPAPSGNPVSAKTVNVKPLIVPPKGYKGDITSESKIVDPRKVYKPLITPLKQEKGIVTPENTKNTPKSEKKAIVSEGEKKTVKTPQKLLKKERVVY